MTAWGEDEEGVEGESASAKPCPPNGSGNRPRPSSKDCTEKVCQAGKKTSRVESAGGQRRGSLERGIGQRPSWAQCRKAGPRSLQKQRDSGRSTSWD